MHARKLPSWRSSRERKADQAASRNGNGDKKSVTKSEERIQSSTDRSSSPSPFMGRTRTVGGQDHEVRTRKGEGVGRTYRRPLLDREQSTSSALAIFRKEVSDQSKYGIWFN